MSNLVITKYLHGFSEGSSLKIIFGVLKRGETGVNLFPGIICLISGIDPSVV